MISGALPASPRGSVAVISTSYHGPPEGARSPFQTLNSYIIFAIRTLQPESEGKLGNIIINRIALSMGYYPISLWDGYRTIFRPGLNPSLATL